MEHVIALVNNLMLLVGEVERAVTLDLSTVGYLRQDCAQSGKVIEEALLLDNLVLAAPLLIELVWQEVEIWQLVRTVLLGNHGAHLNKGCGGIDAGFLQLNRYNDGISLEHKRKQALKSKTARSVDDEVEVLVAHGSDKDMSIHFAVKLGTGYDLIQGLELWTSFKVLLVLFDDTALWVCVEHDETVLVLLDKLVCEHHAVGGFAAAAFLVGEYDNLVFLGTFPDVENWNAHKADCW